MCPNCPRPFNIRLVFTNDDVAHNMFIYIYKERGELNGECVPRRCLIYDDIIGFINLRSPVPKGPLFSLPENIFSRPMINYENVTP